MLARQIAHVLRPGPRRGPQTQFPALVRLPLRRISKRARLADAVRGQPVCTVRGSSPRGRPPPRSRRRPGSRLAPPDPWRRGAPPPRRTRRSSPSASAISRVTASSLAPSQGRSILRPVTALSTYSFTRLEGMAKPIRASPPTREDRRVDADHSAGHVDERTARVAGVDGGVRLDEHLRGGPGDLGAGQRRDDAAGHGLPDAERIADGEHHVAHLERVGVLELEMREAPVAALDPEHGDIGLVVLRITLASNSRRSASAMRISVAPPPMTCLLVTTMPSGLTITPEPSEFGCAPAACRTPRRRSGGTSDRRRTATRTSAPARAHRR